MITSPLSNGKLASNCPLRMILQNQFEYSSLRHVSTLMAKLFGLTELHTFNKTFAPTITLSLSPLLAQNLIVLSPTPWMQPACIPFEFRVLFITRWEAFCLLPAKDHDLCRFISTTQLRDNYNSVMQIVPIWILRSFSYWLPSSEISILWFSISAQQEKELLTINNSQFDSQCSIHKKTNQVIIIVPQ